MANAETAVKNAAHKVSAWTNDDDGVAREWELLKKMIV
jgi:hydroxymethylpyrimidine pyrophosphatase-like HAD family hydrolase